MMFNNITSDENKQKAFYDLINLSLKKDYLLTKDVVDVSYAYNLSICDVDWLSHSLLSDGISIYAKPPVSEDAEINNSSEYEDYAHIDYIQLYKDIIKFDPRIKFLIESIKKISPPQYGEIQKLMPKAKNGDQKARERIIKMYLRSALRIAYNRAKKFQLNLVDCISYAIDGLITAYEKYEIGMKDTFSRYISFWIYQKITRYQEIDAVGIHYPNYLRAKFFSVYSTLEKKCLTLSNRDINSLKSKKIISELLEDDQKYINEVLVQLQDFKSADEIFSQLQNDNEDISQNLKFNSNEFAFDLSENFVTEDESFSSIYLQERSIAFDKILEQLKPVERFVIRARFGFDDGEEKTLEEIGNQMNVTRERIRQIENKALKKLYMKIKNDKCFETSFVCRLRK